MASHITSADIPANGERLQGKHVGLIQLVSLVVFLLGAVASAYAFFGLDDVWHESYTYSWLFAFMFFLTLTLGGCFWTLLHTLTNSGWGVAVRRLMENLGMVFPFMLIIALPLLLPDVQEHLYEWMNKHRSASADFSKPSNYHLYNAHEALLAAKNFYMNIPFWYARIGVFFVGLGLCIWYLRRLSIKQDSDDNADCSRLIWSRRCSTLMMVVFAISATFLAFDFVMGLDFTWFSTMFGVYFFAGCAINSMAVLILTLTWLRSKGYLQIVTSEEHYHIMGKLMHAFVIFWAYVTFSQYMLIWYANIPEETRYFILRNTNEWNIPSTLLVLCHFVIPFVFLLPHYVKKKTFLVVPACIWLLVVHILDLYIMVIPERGPSLTAMSHYKHGLSGNEAKLSQTVANNGGDIDLFVAHSAWIGDVVAFITVGAFFIFVFTFLLRRASLFPNRDPRILESANLHG